MILHFLRRFKNSDPNLLASKLFDQNTFYPALQKDLHQCHEELIIESPFMTIRRISSLLPIFQKLRSRGVKIVINTRPLEEHDDYLRFEAERAIEILQNMSIQVLITGGHHRKLVIIDRKALYEGSLNILSQNDSCEVMRRIESSKLTEQMIRFIKVDKFLE